MALTPIKISAMTAATTAEGTDDLVIRRGAGNFRLSLATLLAELDIITDTEFDVLVADVSNLNNDLQNTKTTLPRFDPTLTPTGARLDVPSTIRVMWPAGRGASISQDVGDISVSLSGPPTNAGLNDTFDPSPDALALTLEGNWTLNAITKAGGAALDAEDVGRTGYFTFTQDATGGRTLAVGGPFRKQGDWSTFDTTADAENLVWFFVRKTDLVQLYLDPEAE